MISERNQIAEKYTADGQYDASIIRQRCRPSRSTSSSRTPRSSRRSSSRWANQEYMRILAEAYDTEDKKEFYEFTKALDALKATLDGDEKTIILSADSELAQILMGAR